MLSQYYGFLSGPGFALSNGLMGLYFGRAADKGNRSKLLAGAAIAWSLTSIVTGRVDSLLVMAIMRVTLGIF